MNKQPAFSAAVCSDLHCVQPVLSAAAGLVKEILPNTRLVALLREPATRALSSINMVIQRGDFAELKQLDRSSAEYAGVWQRVVVRELRKEMAMVNACLARVDPAAAVRKQVQCSAGVENGAENGVEC
jgi:hypothetical protein